MKFTHKNNEIRLSNINEKVSIKGWVQKIRNLGGLLFFDLRDLSGIVQLQICPSSSIYKIALEVKPEYVIYVKGTVIERESKNLKMDSGEIEILVDDIEIVSKSLPLPLVISDKNSALEETRLKYRYLDLRNPNQKKYLLARSKIINSVRNTLIKNEYNEFETPILGKSTPEGARDYLVPSRIYNGSFFALPQSPQIFKQLLMISGFEKYYQIAKCFRDEDLRSDRQPEFTQIDIEASFIEEEDFYLLTEEILKNAFKEVLNIDLKVPFIRYEYDYCLEKYGSDKPDTRFELLIEDYSKIKNLNIPLFAGKDYIYGLLVDNNDILTRKKIEEYDKLVKKNHGEFLAYVKCANNEFSGGLGKYFDANSLLINNKTLFLVAGKKSDTLKSLGALRLELAKDLNLIDEKLFNFLWVTNWPLFDYDEKTNTLSPSHHPFTAPDDPLILKNDPKNARARQYDIVLNGYELGGGSIRIHDTEVQKLMFETLGLTDFEIYNRFGFFVEALKYGTPPHGGIAIGLDRLVMLMTGTNNIKDVICFPKVQSTRDLMMDSPSSVDSIQLNDLGIKVNSK
ncbi:MAG: aspartate--tRNA ligase [Acholeplasmatales bacterium]|jgi:aspartyl-tRNA synthetase|nr:aspartate--tRNA ligase [Acholeplasmatales bacterium]